MKLNLKLVTLSKGTAFFKPSTPLQEYSVELITSHVTHFRERTEWVLLQTLYQVKGWVDGVRSMCTTNVPNGAFEVSIETEDDELRMMFTLRDLPEIIDKILERERCMILDNRSYGFDDICRLFEQAEVPSLPLELTAQQELNGL